HGKHATKADIKDALEHSCDKFKKPMAGKCHKFIDKYGDQIADFLLKEMSPKLICTELGMCLFSEQEDLEVDEALNCVLCEFVMTKLEAELKNKTEQDEIKKALRSICDHLPKTVRKQCDSFVDGYAAAIISLMSSVPPKEVCQKLQLCFSEVVNDEVIECGVFHGVSQVLLSFFRAQKEHDNVCLVID
ncbi:hypothetical protein ACLKA7_000911, partial [Drosophila subpalustris]